MADFWEKSLHMDYKAGLNINISGSCLGNKKNRQFYHSDTVVILLMNMDKDYFSLPAMKAAFESI